MIFKCKNKIFLIIFFILFYGIYLAFFATEYIFQNNKLFAREYEDISGELSPEKQQQFLQTIKVQPLTEEEIAIITSPKFIEEKELQTQAKYQ